MSNSETTVPSPSAQLLQPPAVMLSNMQQQQVAGPSSLAEGAPPLVRHHHHHLMHHHHTHHHHHHHAAHHHHHMMMNSWSPSVVSSASREPQNFAAENDDGRAPTNGASPPLSSHGHHHHHHFMLHHEVHHHHIHVTTTYKQGSRSPNQTAAAHPDPALAMFPGLSGSPPHAPSYHENNNGSGRVDDAVHIDGGGGASSSGGIGRQVSSPPPFMQQLPYHHHTFHHHGFHHHHNRQAPASEAVGILLKNTQHRRHSQQQQQPLYHHGYHHQHHIHHHHQTPPYVSSSSSAHHAGSRAPPPSATATTLPLLDPHAAYVTNESNRTTSWEGGADSSSVHGMESSSSTTSVTTAAAASRVDMRDNQGGGAASLPQQSSMPRASSTMEELYAAYVPLTSPTSVPPRAKNSVNGGGYPPADLRPHVQPNARNTPSPHVTASPPPRGSDLSAPTLTPNSSATPPKAHSTQQPHKGGRGAVGAAHPSSHGGSVVGGGGGGVGVGSTHHHNGGGGGTGHNPTVAVGGRGGSGSGGSTTHYHHHHNANAGGGGGAAAMTVLYEVYIGTDRICEFANQSMLLVSNNSANNNNNNNGQEANHVGVHSQEEAVSSLSSSGCGLLSPELYGNSPALIDAITPFLPGPYPTRSFTADNVADAPTTTNGSPLWSEPMVPLRDIWRSLHFPYGAAIRLDFPVSLSPFLPPEPEVCYEPYLSAVHIQPHSYHQSPPRRPLGGVPSSIASEDEDGVKSQQVAPGSAAAVGRHDRSEPPKTTQQQTSSDAAAAAATSDGRVASCGASPVSSSSSISQTCSPAPFVWYAPERPENRRGLIDQIEILAETECNALLESNTTDLTFDSWFSVLWQPVHCHHHTPQRSCGSFLAFYVFRPAREVFSASTSGGHPRSSGGGGGAVYAQVPPSVSHFASTLPRSLLRPRDAAENGAYDCPVLRTDSAALGFDYWATTHELLRQVSASPDLPSCEATLLPDGGKMHSSASVAVLPGPVRIPMVGLLPIRPRVDVWYHMMMHSSQQRSKAMQQQQPLPYHSPLFLTAAVMQLMRWHSLQQQQRDDGSSSKQFVGAGTPATAVPVGGGRSHNSSPMSYTGSIGGDSANHAMLHLSSAHNSSSGAAAQSPWAFRHHHQVLQGVMGFTNPVGVSDGHPALSHHHHAASSTSVGAMKTATTAARNGDLWNVVKHERHIQDFVRSYV